MLNLLPVQLFQFKFVCIIWMLSTDRMRNLFHIYLFAFFADPSRNHQKNIYHGIHIFYFQIKFCLTFISFYQHPNVCFLCQYRSLFFYVFSYMKYAFIRWVVSNINKKDICEKKKWGKPISLIFLGTNMTAFINRKIECLNILLTLVRRTYLGGSRLNLIHV